MQNWTEIKAAIDKLGTAHKSYRDTNDERLKALEAGDTARADELDVKLGKLNAELDKFGTLKKNLETEIQLHQDRIEQLEALGNAPRKGQSEQLHDEHMTLFTKALRGQFQGQLGFELKAHERKMLEEKAVLTTSGAAGGFAVPEEIALDIEKLERKLSPVRDLVKVVQVGTSDYKELISLGGAASGWVGEAGSRTETATPTLREVTPSQGEIYAFPQASEWSLDDMQFNIQAWLAAEVAEEFAFQEGEAVINGDGTTKPTGMLDGTPVTTADDASPLRAAAVYQYIASTASPEAILADAMIDLVYALNAKYRAMATFVFNSTVAGLIRKLKDTDGAYIWTPGLAAGQPSQLLGYPISIWEQMDDLAAAAHPIAFGNFKRGYLLVDRVGLRITVDQVTTPGFVKFYTRRREGGFPLNNDAIKFLRTV